MNITTLEWMKLPIEQRQQLIERFNLKRSSYTDMRGGVMFSDGFTNEDLKGLEILEVNKTNENETTTSTQDKGTIDSGVTVETGTRQKRSYNKKNTIPVRSQE